MASVKEIPKTASEPTNPDAPSFLTHLPPEMRNAIYEVLFKRDKPVLVHNASVYHTDEPEQENSRDVSEFTERMHHFDEVYEAEIGGDAEFRYEFHLALPFFRSCRQIYHESAGVFYGSNKFVISRARYRMITIVRTSFTATRHTLN